MGVLSDGGLTLKWITEASPSTLFKDIGIALIGVAGAVGGSWWGAREGARKTREATFQLSERAERRSERTLAFSVDYDLKFFYSQQAGLLKLIELSREAMGSSPDKYLSLHFSPANLPPTVTFSLEGIEQANRMGGDILTNELALIDHQYNAVIDGLTTYMASRQAFMDRSMKFSQIIVQDEQGNPTPFAHQLRSLDETIRQIEVGINLNLRKILSALRSLSASRAIYFKEPIAFKIFQPDGQAVEIKFPLDPPAVK